jgi:hypothetical protein
MINDGTNTGKYISDLREKDAVDLREENDQAISSIEKAQENLHYLKIIETV